MSENPRSWTDLQWIEPESRFLMRTVFRRNLDAMTDSARRTVNWSVLVLDVVVIYLLLEAL